MVCVLVLAGVFHDTFHSLSHIVPEVLYPVPDCLSAAQQSEQCSLVPDDVQSLFLSINRYERKKNIALAIDAMGLSAAAVHIKSLLYLYYNTEILCIGVFICVCHQTVSMCLAG